MKCTCDYVAGDDSQCRVHGQASMDEAMNRALAGNLPRLKVQFKLLQDGAQTPTKAHEHDSGWDLYAYPAIQDKIDPRKVIAFMDSQYIRPGESQSVYCGVALCAPPGWGYTLRGRSSLNLKNLHLLLATMDSGYCGPVFAILYNASREIICIKKGDRIAQAVFEPVVPVELEKVDEFDTQVGTRGPNGFGSSGR